jgi:hypothetical protein
MSDDMPVDVVIGSTEPQAVDPIEEQLRPLGPARAEPTREPVTILALTAGVVALAKALVELWQTRHPQAEHAQDGQVKSEHPQVSITIEVQSGATLQLGDVRSAAEIEEFIAAHAPR